MNGVVSRAFAHAFLACAVGASGVLAGCVTPAQNRRDGLVRVAQEFNDGLRWRRADQVTAHLPPDEVASFMERMASLSDDFEMADHEVTGIAFAEDGTRADVDVDFTWYNQRRSLLRHTVVAQDWRYRDGRWVCAKQRRLRGDRLPLILEPAGLQPADAPAPR